MARSASGRGSSTNSSLPDCRTGRPRIMNLGQLLVNTARRLPEQVAVSFGDRSLTYAELDRRTDALARGLNSLGAHRGDRVGVLMRNCPELLEAMFACFKAGYCLVPLNARFTADEISYHLADAGATALITDAARLDAAKQADVRGVQLVVTEGRATSAGVHPFEALISDHGTGSSSVSDTDRDDLAWLFYTSGTTGRPKGAMLTHGNLAFVVASWLADLTPMTDHDTTLHAAPLTHGAGFHALAATARGARQVILADTRFDPEAVLALLATHGITNTWMVPTQIIMLTDVAAATRPTLPDLRYVVYGGAPFAPAELRRALEVFGPIFVQLFGQGETPMTATVLPPRDHAEALAGERPDRLSSAGYARPGMDVRVLGDDDTDVALGIVGEVCVRGPSVMRGYWQRPDASAAALRNGWLHTGDLGRMDEHGYLYLLDRAKDLIITGGSNVYAVEVEAHLAEHPAVHDVAVIGVPDRTWGETVVALVVTDTPEADTEKALAAHCHGLASYKRPRRYAFIDELPRNAYGKVLKRELRSQFAEPPE
jgi:acyl-CoA synthetase (AMP-forming)/AMP-acid ligase II